MPNPTKSAFLEEVKKRYGALRKMEKSESLYEVGPDAVRLYFRYSKKHPRNRTFFGLRRIDLQALEGHHGILCFCWDGQSEPLFVPFAQFEDVFATLSPASDGQIKAQVYENVGGTELYLANAGRFNVESYMGWDFLDSMIRPAGDEFPELAHNQVQTLLGGIGAAKGFDIWIQRWPRKRSQGAPIISYGRTGLSPRCCLSFSRFPARDFSWSSLFPHAAFSVRSPA